MPLDAAERDAVPTRQGPFRGSRLRTVAPSARANGEGTDREASV
jgi:hypothetical protein